MHEEAQKSEFELIMDTQAWSAESIRTLQRDRLEALLRHARVHVPFYATRLDPLFRAGGSINWDRWQDVPILTRSDLLGNRREMLAREMPPGHGRIGDIATSGSTGKPVTTSHSSLSLELTKAAVFRANVNDGVDFGARIGVWAGTDASVAPWPEGRRGGRWGPWWDESAGGGEVFEINHTVPAHQVLEFMSRNNVRYAMMGGMDARLLAHEAERLHVTLPLDAILTRGTDATPAGRELIARVFKARTLSLYSSKEAHRIAHLCGKCGKWHINDEQVLVELLDDAGLPVRAGSPGRVVVTPLWSFAQPLIRYEQGDLATVADETCGRGLTALESIVGRLRHMFVMPDGSRIVPDLSVPSVLALKAAMFQVAQVAPDAVELRYVALRNTSRPDTEPALAELTKLLHPGIRLDVREVDTFDVAPEQKHIEFVCEFPDGAAPYVSVP